MSGRKHADDLAGASPKRLRDELARQPAEAEAADEWYAPAVRNLVQQGLSAAEILDYLEKTTRRRHGFGPTGSEFEGLFLWEQTAVRALADDLREPNRARSDNFPPPSRISSQDGATAAPRRTPTSRSARRSTAAT